jgi:hypothetical protein
MSLSDDFKYRRRVFGYNEENQGMNEKVKSDFRSKQDSFLAARSPLDESFPRCSYTAWTDGSNKRCAFAGTVGLYPMTRREYCSIHALCMRNSDHDKGFKILKQSLEVLKAYLPEEFIDPYDGYTQDMPKKERWVGYV